MYDAEFQNAVFISHSARFFASNPSIVAVERPVVCGLVLSSFFPSQNFIWLGFYMKIAFSLGIKNILQLSSKQQNN